MGKFTHNQIHKTGNYRLFGWKLLTVLTLFISAGLLVVFINVFIHVFIHVFSNFQTSSKEVTAFPSVIRYIMNRQDACVTRILSLISVPHNNGNFCNSQSRSLIKTDLGQNLTQIQKPHPLPLSLQKWQDETNSGDYFDYIRPTPVGYLIWSQFPVKVKIVKPTGISELAVQTWLNHVLQSVQEWNVYLPLEVVENSDIADITIFRKSPPLQIEPGSKVIRARSALTSYQFFYENDVLSHRFTILLSPNQTGEYLQSAARHEIGHALGIWGHSPLQTDALYFSQVSKPVSISTRDVNTLKQIYQQSTSLGWLKVQKQ